MPRFRVICLLLIGLFCFAGFACGAEAPADGAAEQKTLLYVARHIGVADLANALSGVLKSRDEDASVVAEPVTNHLLITAGQPTLEKVTKILAELDKPPKMVSIEVQIVRASRKVDPKQDASTPAAEGYLLGSAEKVLAKLRELEKSGLVDVRDRIRLATLDKQPAFVQVGARKAVVRAVSSASRPPSSTTRSQFSRPTTRSVSYENVGMMVKVTPRVTPDGLIVLELNVEKSDLDSSSADGPSAADEEAASFHPSQIDTCKAQTTVSVASGETVVMGGMETVVMDRLETSETGRHTHLFILVSAEILER